jgi:ParB family transcriptional regulator, chromosome partitioning protein
MAHAKAKDGGSHTDMWAIEPEKLVIVADESHELYDERVKLPVSESLVASIMYAPNGADPQGVLVPIACSRDPETGAIVVVNGRQRVKACIEANKRLEKQGLDPLRVKWYPASRGTKAKMALQLTANEHAQEDTPLGRAKKAQRYLERGFSVEEVGEMLGKSPATIKNLVGLLDAPAAVRKAVESGAVSASDGYKLAKLDPDEAKKKVEELKASAPREPGKKRSQNAKKARKIVTGSAPVRGKKEILEKLAEVQRSEAINENKRMGAEAALMWVLGDDAAMRAIL